MQGLSGRTSSSDLAGRMPDAFVILFVIIVLASIASHAVPQGSFQTSTEITEVNGQVVEKTRILADSFRYAEQDDRGVALFASDGQAGMLNYAFDGLTSGDRYGSAVGVVAFILVVGGAFGIVMQSGAIHNGILALVNKTKGSDWVILPLMFVLFSLGGAIFGMGEEAIAFCIILVPLVIALGYDAITGVLITYIATQIGFATSWMNPFSVAIAQGIADVPLLSGQAERMAIWALFTAIGVALMMLYARHIKANPTRSLSHVTDRYFRDKQQHLESQFTILDSIILLTFAVGIVWVIWGVVVHAYYIPEIATQFFAIGILVGVIALLGKRMTANSISSAFQQGAKDLLPAALIVGMAKGIILILGAEDVTTPSTLNTLLYYASQAIGETSSYTTAVAMFVFQAVFNFFVASGSGQAAITMPLMAPLSDLLGVSRQVAVLAFQLGDGLSNIIIPTSASLIGCLGVARVDWSVWFKFIWKPFLVFFVMSIGVMIVAVAIGFK